MVARNDITGDAIQSKASTKAFNDNYDLIFRKNKMTPAVEDMKKGTCGCGRSPTGDCIGWHGLSEEAYKQALEKYNIDEVSKLIAEETLQATDRSK
jgi:hypothetical protein